MTNGEMLRQMDDDALGDFLDSITGCCGQYNSHPDCENCPMHINGGCCSPWEWLQMDADQPQAYNPELTGTITAEQFRRIWSEEEDEDDV